MSDSPDLAKLVGLIMENPELIAQITSLAAKEGEKPEIQEKEAQREPATEPIPTSAPAPTVPQTAAILGAMKPYLSEKRQRALDSMATIAQMLSMMKRR